MRYRIAFQKRGEMDDGYGGTITGPFATVFEEPARLKPGIGSETVIASRIAGIQPFTITIRSSERTRQVTPAWRAVDVRAGETGGQPNRVFDIKAIANPDEWDQMLNIVAVES